MLSLPIHRVSKNHRQLAAAVIQQAIDDAESEAVESAVRANARAFLAGSRELHVWCSVAGISVEQIQALLAA